VSTIDELKAYGEWHPGRFPGPLPSPPARKVAIVTCMDARIDVYRLFGLKEGDAHVIRNAGGLVTPDVLRSLAISERVLGTREILLMNHTKCGLIDFDADGFARQITDETGVEPAWTRGALHDLDEDVRRNVAALRDDPILPATEVRGFVYDVESGQVREVATSD
jgi:carbonic anhydrase